jgi:hypothetical protein
VAFDNVPLERLRHADGAIAYRFERQVTRPESERVLRGRTLLCRERAARHRERREQWETCDAHDDPPGVETV